MLGRKLGMTQIFTDDGNVVPVTVIEAPPGCVVQIKTAEKDGYESVKVGFFEVMKKKSMNRPEAGVFEKAGTKPYKELKEFKMGGGKEGEALAVGDFITVERFAKGDMVSVRGVTKGKGFQGVMKRHNFKGGPASHGSMFKRAPGSIGASAYPSRVWKNQRMPGHMGSVYVTTKNLEVAGVKAEQNLLLIKGSVPGAKGAVIEIRKEG